MAGFAGLRGESRLVVYIDLKSPYAFIAIEPTRELAAARGLEVDWRPFTLDIPSYLGSATLDRRGKVETSDRTPQQWTGVRYAYRDARRYASLRGKTLRGTEKIWNSRLAGIAMLWAGREGAAALDRFLDHAYPKFWKRALDIEDLSVLESALREVEVDPTGFAAFVAGEGGDEHDAINEAAFDAGVFGVPTYLAGDEAWFGREHLPRVAWLLDGSEGRAPDAANRAFRAVTEAPNQRGGSLEVCLDLRSPFSYLALHPALSLAASEEIELDLLPLTAPTLKPPSSPRPGDDRGIRHRRARAKAIEREVEAYAEAQGLVLREIHRDGPADVANQAWLWVREHRRDRLPDFLVEMFRAYWAGTLDPSSTEEIGALLDRLGFDGSAFLAWRTGAGATALGAVADALAARGLFQVPAFVVDDEVFYGRQHLPMIRWVLHGRTGPIPI